MDVDKLFKLPSIPSGKNKRKLPATPNLELLKRSRVAEEDESEQPSIITDKKGKGKSVIISDLIEGLEHNEDYQEEEEEDGRFYGGGLTEEQKKILDFVDQAEVDETENLDAPSIRKMILKFEKAITKNQELRVKYPDQPAKFMESEADLDEEIKHLMTLTEAPDLYPLIVELGTVTHLASLLTHENTDISIDVVELLNDLTDEDVAGEENEEGMKVLVDALLENQVPELLIQNLRRLDEEETVDKQGVFNTLGVVENLTSFEPSMSEKIVQNTNIMQWILARLKIKGFDSNKQYASEILAILLQNSRANRLVLGELNGVDVLLQVLNAYKRKDPKDDDETEMMENLFDALCLAVTEPEIKQKFLEGEGVELMLIMIKEKKMSRMRSIKVLDHAMWTRYGAANCEKFVDIFGLKTLFATFMRKGLRKFKKNYKSFSEAEEEEHIIGIIVSLLKNLPKYSENRLRLVQKFSENDYEKVDRLLEMRENYEVKVAIVDREIEERKKELEDDDTLDDDTLEEFYRRRLAAGLFTMQLVDLTIAWICEDDFKVKQHVKTLLNRRGRSLVDVRMNLEEYLKKLGDGNQPSAELQQNDNPVIHQIKVKSFSESQPMDLDDNEQPTKTNTLKSDITLQDQFEKEVIEKLVENLEL
ncbi:hypothetical protein G9A89_013866 [Geosiphon pyriformis]|nr:hypothetical protein G9A89_013866 [Geosiphon pyriformis]